MNVIVYHQVKPGIDCPDGICAAWIAARALGYETVELVPEVYRSEQDKNSYLIPFDARNKTIVFVDWAGYSEFNMFAISRSAKKVIILDHHKSQAETLHRLGSLMNLFVGYVPNEIGCGASIAWDYFFPDTPQPDWLKSVRLRDTGMGGYWQGKQTYHESVNAALSRRRKGKSGWDAFPVFDELLATTNASEILYQEGLESIVNKNLLCRRVVDKWKSNPVYVRLSLAAEVVYKGDSHQPKVPFLQITDPSLDRYCSWIGIFLAEVTDSPYVAIVTSAKTSVSLRKRPESDCDLSEVAKLFGGGGHDAAAAFSIK
jgi:oligoribonuclease NrnB/cAMP/cGMP phosphodiesterase (DHH superfamily)